MVSVAIWLVSRGRNFTHALMVSADLGAKNGLTPDECEAMQCALGFACSTAENVTEAYRGALEAARLKKEATQRVGDVAASWKLRKRLWPPIFVALSKG
jgi:hypothetical protein